jgi:hypothetical protein
MTNNELLVRVTRNGVTTTFNDYGSGVPTYLLNNTAALLSGLTTRVGRNPRQSSHGADFGPSQEDERTLKFEGYIIATDQEDCKGKERMLNRCLALPLFQDVSGDDGSALVEFTDVDGTEFRCYARVFAYPEFGIVDNADPSMRSFTFVMIAADPLLYGNTLETETGDETVVGTNFSIIQGQSPTFPFTLIQQTAHSLTANNAGATESPPLIIVYGPSESPVVTNQTTGKKMALTRLGGLTLLAGERVEINAIGLSITKIDASDVETDASGYLSTDSEWITLIPGDNDMTLIDDSEDVIAAVLETNWRPTYR